MSNILDRLHTPYGMRVVRSKLVDEVGFEPTINPL